eukprot:comp8419_c0_seq1/m.3773 comp8419_c0_seq1/g.3773  ORF comp8419_c0_seq1/g.3773 comp8419_c0_seq1/m.3773 type:complete len:128 (-) comp8419_c0_seq1:27-410(-)
MSAATATIKTVKRAVSRPAAKAVLSLTPAAVNRVKSLLAENHANALKVGVQRRGCNGLSFTMSLAEKKDKFDEEVVVDGARVLIDSKALMSVIGSEMDYVDEKLSAGFVFNNPNVKHSCACGESFTT